MNKPAPQTIGKQLGKIAFYISEIISVCSLILILINFIITKNINIEHLNALMFYQGAILTVTWGAKATSNFAKPKKDFDAGEVK